MTDDYVDMMMQFETPSNPFPGLRPFEFNESLLYFGRDGQSEQLLRKLSVARFMAVIGTSGSGKSSLVRAGLLPALFGGFMASAGSDWRIAIFRPSNDPIGNLARAINDSGVFGENAEPDAGLQTMMTEATLRRGSLGLVEAIRQARIGSHENVLVVVDQFEELFRFEQVAESEQYKNDAAAFVKLLLESSRQKEVPIYVVLTMRSDFLGDCSRFWDLPEAINEGQYLIPRLTREQRREAITGPIAVCGADITPRLVNRLLNDMGDNPDQLPILQHALMRTWQNWKENHRADEPIDLHHYEEIGGMSAALSRHADEAYNELPDERSRKIAEKMFKGLTEKGADNREIRRPIELKELCALTEASQEEVIRVIEVFRREDRSFLMPPAVTRLDGNSLIDISHESLIRNWERLKNWVDDEARSARIYSRLAETAVLYPKEVPLYSDPALQLALDWRDESRPNKTWARRYHPEFNSAIKFLDASREARDCEARDREAHRRKEVKRTRLTILIFALAFLLALAAFVFANKKGAESKAGFERSRHLLYASNLNLAQSVYYEENVQRAQELLEDDTTKQDDLPGFEWGYLNWLCHRDAGTLDCGDGNIRDLAYSPDGKYLATAGDHFVKLWDAQSRQEFLSLPTNGGPVNALAFSPDSKLLAYGGEDSLVRLWKVGSTEEPAVLRGDGKPITTLVFSQNGKTLVTGGRSVKLWDVASRKERFKVPDVNDNVRALALSPNDDMLAVVSAKDNLILFDFGFHNLKYMLAVTDPTSVTFSPDGKIIIVGIRNGYAFSFLDAKSLAQLAELDGFFSGSDSTNSRSSVVFSPDGKKVAISNSKALKLYDSAILDQPEPLKLLTPLLGQQGFITSLAFSPDGKTLAANDSGYVRFWDATWLRESVMLGKHNSEVEEVAISSDSRTILAKDLSTGLKMWDIASQQELSLSADTTEKFSGVDFSLVGRFLATTNNSGVIKLWDIMSRNPVATFSEQLAESEKVSSVMASPDGKTVAAVNMTATSDDYVYKLRLWNVDSPQEPVTLTSARNYYLNPSFSPDGRTIAYYDNVDDLATVHLLDVASEEAVSFASASIRSVYAIDFSPDGSKLVVIGRNSAGSKNAELWDARSRKFIKILAQWEFELTCAFSPDNQVIAVGSMSDLGPVVTLWDLELVKPLAILRGYTQPVLCMAFSPDFKTFATGSRDGLVKLWSTSSHRLLITLYNQEPVSSIAFSPDNRMVVTGGPTGSVKLWPTLQ